MFAVSIQDADHMIRGFLGRDLNPGAFFTVKGLTA